MSKLLQKLLLSLLLPIIGYVIVYQINPGSMAGGSGVLSLLPILGKLMAANPNAKTEKPDLSGLTGMTGVSSPAQLSNLLWPTSASSDTSDTLAGGVKGKKDRDPMIPALLAEAQSNVILTRASSTPSMPTRFPITRSDITGIFWDAKAPIVLIWRKPYQIGSAVRGATITAINRTSVTFEWQRQTIVIELVKKRAE